MESHLLSISKAQTINDINWHNWQAKDPATLLFVVKNHEILLIRKKRGFGAGKINGPGGKLEHGETFLDCAIREVQEELCITPINPSYIGEHLFQFTDGYSVYVHTFMASDFTGTPTETDEAIPLWFSLDEIPYHEMWEDDQYWLPMALAGKFFQGHYLFNGDNMLDHKLQFTDTAPSYD